PDCPRPGRTSNGGSPAWVAARSRVAMPGSRRLALAASALGLAIFIGLVADGPGGGPAGGPGPQPGDPCRSLHRYPVRLVPTGDGGTEAQFALAGGAAQGARRLSPADIATLVGHRAIFATDVQLGSYEQAPTANAGSLV